MAARAGKATVRISKNRITLKQVHIACRHFQELRKAHVTENLAIRIVEHFVDVYAKILMGGSATPHHADDVPQSHWSLAAIKARARNPSMRYGDYLRVEHGTPRRAFASKVLELYRQDKLTERKLDDLVKKLWVLAVITTEEDKRLNLVARSKAYSCPEERYRAAGIKFPRRSGSLHPQKRPK